MTEKHDKFDGNENPKPNPVTFSAPKEDATRKWSKVEIEEDEGWEDTTVQEHAESNPFKKLTISVKKRYEQMKERDGVAPTFEDYIHDLINIGGVDSEEIKKIMVPLAASWKLSELGPANYSNLYEELYNEPYDKKPTSYSSNTKEFNLTAIKEVDNKVIEEVVVKPKKKNRNKFVLFIHNIPKYIFEISREIDNEIIKLFREIGSLMLTLVALGLYLVYQVTYFIGVEELFDKLIIFLSIAGFIAIVYQWENRKKSKTIYLVAILLCSLLLLLFVIILSFVGWEIFSFFQTIFTLVKKMF